MRTLKQIQERLKQIKSEMEKDDADIEALSKEVDELLEERDAIEAQAKQRNILLAKIAGGELGETVGDGVTVTESRDGIIKSSVQTDSGNISDTLGRNARGKTLKESGKAEYDAPQQRSLLLSTGNIAKPTQVSGINDLPGVVSSIVDLVFVEDCTGMGEDKVAYQVTESSASTVTEGQAPTTSEPTFDFVTITPTKYGLMSYVSEDIRNQTPLNYEEKVTANCRKALRKKAAEVITTKVYASTLCDVLEMTAINDKTLRQIALNYSSDSEVDGNAWLFLSKADLIAFGDVRGTNEKKAVYEITPDTGNPNTGIIKDGGLSVKYCINPNCNNLTNGTNTSTTAVKPTMFYGQPQNIKMDLFGSMKVSMSEDYKFAEGLLAIRGVAPFGVDMAAPKGIMLIAIPKAS